MNIPIVTLDKIYIKPDEKNVFFLDCTRVNGSKEIISRKKESLDNQIIRLAKELKNKKIIIADDVVFSGYVLRTIIKKFDDLGILVVGVITDICTNNAFNYFNDNIQYGIRTNYLMMDDVIDQICERDFYFGIAGSGIMIRQKNALYKSPYFKPYGNPFERASVPLEYVDYFSKGCLERSLYLWSEIDKLRSDDTRIWELPERIINTNNDDTVQKTLRLGMKK